MKCKETIGKNGKTFEYSRNGLVVSGFSNSEYSDMVDDKGGEDTLTKGP